MAASSILMVWVGTSNSGFVGASNGALMPVKLLISPALALAYRPFTSRCSQTSKRCAYKDL